MIDTKDCERCGKTFERPDYAEGRDWRDRRFCSRSCSSKSQRKIGIGGKPCLHCGITMERPESMITSDWVRRKYCGRQCVADSQREAASAPRTCIQCGKVFQRPRDCAAGAWAVMKTCGPECRSQRMKRPIIDVPLLDDLNEMYVNQKLTCDQIGQKLSVSDHTVKRWLKQLGIKARRNGVGLESRGLSIPSKEELHHLIHVEGKSFREIAEPYGVDFTAVSYWMKKYGLVSPKAWVSSHGEVSFTDKETLDAMYDSGMTVTQIGLHFGISINTTVQAMKAFGIQRRKAGFNYNNDYICQNGLEVKSAYERRVGDWLLSSSIDFVYEPGVPFHSKWKGDFLVNGWFLEIWGVVGWEKYDEKRRKKTDWYTKYSVPLIEILPYDFSRPGYLDRVMSKCLEPPIASLEPPRKIAVIGGKRKNREGAILYRCEACQQEFVPKRGRIYAGQVIKYCSYDCYIQGRFYSSKVVEPDQPKQGFLFD